MHANHPEPCFRVASTKAEVEHTISIQSNRTLRRDIYMQLSFYVLTFNSEKHIDTILQQVKKIVDEIIIVDSGSTDRTKEIALRYTDYFFERKFDNYINQREYAIQKCSNEWLFFLDSDEIPSSELIESIEAIKRSQLDNHSAIDAYQVPRYWYVMGKKVHSLYPVCSPDTPVRLFRKSKASYDESSLVHETITGFSRVMNLTSGHIDHYTFETTQESVQKLEKYTTLAAIDARMRGKKGSKAAAISHALPAFFKWYFLKGAIFDGITGVHNGIYAYRYTYLKYIKLMRLGKNQKR